jgi:hypothetical protein
MFLSDTNPKAASIQIGLLRSLSPGDRLRLTMEMSDFVKRLKLSVLRTEHPELAEFQLKELVLRTCFSDDSLPAFLR